MTIETLITLALAFLGTLLGYRLGVSVGYRTGRRDAAGGIELESWRNGHEAGLRNAGIVRRHNHSQP